MHFYRISWASIRPLSGVYLVGLVCNICNLTLSWERLIAVTEAAHARAVSRKAYPLSASRNRPRRVWGLSWIELCNRYYPCLCCSRIRVHLKFKCVSPACIGETGHVREESLFSYTLGFGRLRVVKGAENNVATHQSRRTESVGLESPSKRCILNENGGERGKRVSPFCWKRDALRGKLFSSKKMDSGF